MAPRAVFPLRWRSEKLRTLTAEVAARLGISQNELIEQAIEHEVVARGAMLSYALNAHSPWEGYRIAVNGTEGRAELEVVERAAVLVGADGNVVVDPSAHAEQAK